MGQNRPGLELVESTVVSDTASPQAAHSSPSAGAGCDSVRVPPSSAGFVEEAASGAGTGGPDGKRRRSVNGPVSRRLALRSTAAEPGSEGGGGEEDPPRFGVVKVPADEATFRRGKWTKEEEDYTHTVRVCVPPLPSAYCERICSRLCLCA